MKRDEMINVFSSEKSVTFIARQPNGDPVTLNGKPSVTIMFQPNNFIAFQLLYTEQSKFYLSLIDICACACVYVRVGACMHACICVLCVGVCMYVMYVCM